MAHQVRCAAILVPGGEVFVTEAGETLEGTNTENRCRFAVKLKRDLREQGYDIVIFFTSGAADHPGQTEPTGQLTAECIRSLDPQVIVISDDAAWDTGENVVAFRRLLKSYGWWRWGRPQADLYVVSEDYHTKRCQILFFRRYAVLIRRHPTDDMLSPEKLQQEKKLLAITYVPFSEYLLSWYAKRLRQAARAG